MGWFKLGHMTLKSLFSKPATSRYPVEQPTYPENARGHIEIDIDACNLCSLCEKRCPSDAITVNRDEQTWSIDPFSCVQCGACVAACNRHCLTMVNTYSPPATEKRARVRTKEGPTEPATC